MMNFKRKRGPGRVLCMLLVAAAFLAAIGGIVMLLWNNVVSPVFHISTITYWQSVGLFLLCKILLGSFRPHAQRGHFRSKRRLRERFMNMSAEEREKFKEEWRRRFSGRDKRC